MIQSSSTSTVMNSLGFQTTALGATCNSVYGSDFTSFASGGYVWSSSIDLKIICAAGNVSGTLFKGAMNVSQLYGSVTIGQLIQDACCSEAGDTVTTLTSAVVNPALVNDINSQCGTSATNTFPDGENEIVSYVVYQTPVISLTTNLSVPFTWIASTQGNFVYYTKVSDPLAFNIGNEKTKPKPETTKTPAILESIAPLANNTVQGTGAFHESRRGVERMLDHPLDETVWHTAREGEPGLGEASFGAGQSDDPNHRSFDISAILDKTVSRIFHDNLPDVNSSMITQQFRGNGGTVLPRGGEGYRVSNPPPNFYCTADMSKSFTTLGTTLQTLITTVSMDSTVQDFKQWVDVQLAALERQPEYFTEMSQSQNRSGSRPPPPQKQSQSKEKKAKSQISGVDLIAIEDSN